jgi:hypothetical protein
MQFEIRTIEPGARIHYTLDGSEPTQRSPAYHEPIRIAGPTTLKAFATKQGFSDTPVITAHFHAIHHAWSIDLRHRYDNQYTAGGDRALVDGLRGTDAWRTGAWQGYLEDIDLVIDFGEVREVSRLALGCLQDTQSWIWMPERIAFELSVDGVEFREIAHLEPDAHDRERERRIEDFGVDLDRARARCVRITAQNRHPSNEGYPGLGGTAWIFTDEVLVEFADGR